jgi:excisionase family DNA binding protein
MSNLVIKSKNDGELIAEIITNQNLTFDAAMELAGYIYCDGDPDGDPNATGWTIDHNTYWTQEDTDWGRDEYLTTNEIAERLNIDPATVRRWCISGKLTAVKFGRDWLIPEREAEGLTRSSAGRPPKK